MRFVLCTLVLLIIGGVLLHQEIELPGWYGNLPGDMIVSGKHFVIPLPLVSSAAIGLLITMVLSGFSKKT